MKKLIALFAFVATLSVVACNGGGHEGEDAEKAKQDSIRMADSIAAVEKAKADSIAAAEAAMAADTANADSAHTEGHESTH